MVHALVLAHVQWCVQRFPSDPLGFYETFPPPARSGRIWAHREELLGLIRRCVSRDAEAAGRIMLVLAPAALALGGRDALDELSTHLDLCVDSLEHCDAHFHLLLIKAELMFRRSGHLIDTMALFEQARRQYLDQASPKRPLLELCLASRETTLAAFRGLPAQEVMRLAQHVWQLVEDLNVPDFFAPQALRLIHNAHKELGEVDQAISCVERALELATSRHLPQTAMLCKLSLMASLMDLELIVRARSMGQELLVELDPAHSPRMYFFAKFLLGYMLYGEGELGEASMHLEQAREYMASSHDTHSLLIIHQLLALTELELGRVDKALDWQYRVGWPLMNSARQPMNSSWWVALIGALVYAWCNESFSAQRMLLDARAYACRHEMPGDPWVLEWVDAMCAVILAVQNKSETFPVEQALMALDAVRKTYATRTHFYDQLVRVVSGVERFCERWLNAHGHTLEREPTLHVDVLDDPSCFALPPGATVSLTRRQSMRRILGALITHHRQGATLLCMEELFAIGWPGEVATSDSMSARVYNTLSRMRKLGLDALILHNGDGYMLDPSCLVVCDQDAPGHDGQVSSQR
jgi:tetratricopeptide (TPR) repeat protein